MIKVGIIGGVIGHHRDARQRSLDGCDHGLVVVAVLRLLPGQLHQGAADLVLDRLLDKYRHWSTYTPEERSVAVFYGSMYGDTENAVNILTSRLAEAGVKNIAVYDVSSTHVSTMIAEVFRCSHLVLAAPTYNNGVYPAMLNLLHDMKALNLQNRTVALMENGSWAPSCARQMRALLEEMKSMEILEPVVTLKSALKDDSLAQLDALRDALIASLMSE